MHNISAILRAARASGPRPNKIKTMSDGAAKVLMVDQLWLFVVDEETVVTFAAPKEKTDDPLSEQGDVRNLLYKDINGDHANQCNDCYDFAALAVATAVKALLDHTDDPNLQVFRIFEEYISELVSLRRPCFESSVLTSSHRLNNKPNRSRHVFYSSNLYNILTRYRIFGITIC